MFSSNSPHHTFQRKCKSIVFPVVLSRSCIRCFWVHWVRWSGNTQDILFVVALLTLFFDPRLVSWISKHKTSLVMILKCIHIYVVDILKLYIFESMGSHHIRSASDKDSMTTSMNLQFQTKKVQYVIRRCNHLAFSG